MTNAELEKRLIKLEADVAWLKKKFAEKERAKNLLFTQKKLTPAQIAMEDEAYKLGREYRESQKMNYDED